LGAYLSLSARYPRMWLRIELFQLNVELFQRNSGSDHDKLLKVLELASFLRSQNALRADFLAHFLGLARFGCRGRRSSRFRGPLEEPIDLQPVSSRRISKGMLQVFSAVVNR
jgi:hypothetical protein